MKHLLPFIFLPLLHAQEKITFNAEIRPILSAKCMHCHGPDEGKDEKGKSKRRANLRLDIADGPDGAYRIHKGSQAITPGSPEDSEVWQRIIDKDDPMPPVDGHSKALSSAEKELIKTWIQQGAEYETFWAFVPAKKHSLPKVTAQDWSQHPIDRFTLAKMEKKGKQPNAKADKRTLVRRLSLDLTGLPPSRKEVQAFLNDSSPNAYQNLVDRLIAKPQYGEHMAKYWLDLVRFADTNGMHHDHFRDQSPYRDWVIKAFNKNLPYNEFTKYQIAGDLYPKPTQEQLIASGFNRLHLIIDVGTALPEESHFKNVVDRVSSVGTAFMGLTMQCAVCHDHKYDPITQKDFFQMYAFFNNFDGKPETGDRYTSNFYRGLQAPYINLTTPEQDKKLAAWNIPLRQLNRSLKLIKKAQKSIGKKDALAEEIKATQGEIKKRTKTRDGFLRNIRGAMVMKERKEVRETHLRIRGNYDQMGEVVNRDTPHFLPKLKKKGKTATRMDLAKWLVAPQNPLTARVAVNRFWQQLFGTGLVKTSEDFGAQGQWPSHPKLLDYLTTQFVESGWDTKALMKSLVMTETYQQSSVGNSLDFQNDPENRLLARGSRIRLDSEIIRDQLLAVTGKLNLETGGRSVKTPQPAGLWEMVKLGHTYPGKFVPAKGAQANRRSIYTFWKRGLAPPQMTIFDAPVRDACIARRERTNTPLQALLMMNEENYFNAAKEKARQILAEKGSEEEKLTKVYETITAQLPSPETIATLKKGLNIFREEGDELHSWTMAIHTLLNTDAFKNRE